MKNNQPLISIVMPTRNRETFIGDALKSVLNQSYQNLEIIVQNNNSKDNTEKIVKSFKDPRIRYYKSNDDLSLLSNWSGALNKAKGDYFLRLDDDNILFSSFIEDAYNSCIENNLDGITYNSFIISNKLEIKLLNKIPSKKKIKILNWKELVFLTYNAFIDSNYSLYNLKKLKELIGNQLYKTTLPDRYLDYKLSFLTKKSKFKFGYNPLPNSVTRFDHLPGFNKNYIYKKFIKRDVFEKKLIGNELHSNFQMHKITSLNVFLDECSDEEITKHINFSILNPKLKYFYSFFHHIYEAKRNVQTLSELFKYYTDNIIFINHIFRNANTKGLEKSAIVYFLIVIKNLIISSKNYIIKKKRPQYFFDKRIGDKIIMNIKNIDLNNLKSVTESI